MTYSIYRSIRRVLSDHGEIYPISVFVAIQYILNLRGGITMDEAFYAQAGFSFFNGYMYGNPTHMHAPLIKYFIGLSQVLFGPTEVAIRAPIALIGVLSIVATYCVARYVFDRTSGTIAAILVAVLPTYNYYATMAMLDVPLALFVLLAFGTTVWWHRNPSSSKPPAALGILTVFAGATKVQGAIYVFGFLGILTWMATIEHRGRWKTIFLSYAVASAITFAIVYFPFAFSPAPDYYGGTRPPQIAEVLFSIPWLGGVAFAFAASVVHNLSHLDNGHRVVVLAQTYYRPPAWVLLFWFGKYGGVPYLVGLTTSVASVFDRVGDRGVRIGFTGLLVFPLLTHAILSVKLSRYLVPLYPLVAVAAGWGFVVLARTVLNTYSVDLWTPHSSKFQVISMVIALLLIASLVPPAFITTVTEESIRTDTGIDDGANIIAEYAEREEEVTAVVSNPLPYRWYLGEKEVGRFTKNVHNPKTFHSNGASVTLVGPSYDNIGMVLDQRSPCLFMMSHSWVDRRDSTDPVYRYLEDQSVVEDHSRVRVYNSCSSAE